MMNNNKNFLKVEIVKGGLAALVSVPTGLGEGEYTIYACPIIKITGTCTEIQVIYIGQEAYFFELQKHVSVEKLTSTIEQCEDLFKVAKTAGVTVLSIPAKHTTFVHDINTSTILISSKHPLGDSTRLYQDIALDISDFSVVSKKYVCGEIELEKHTVLYPYNMTK